MNLLIISLIVLLPLFLFTVATNTAILGLQNVFGQEHNNEKTYVLLFEPNKIGNIDNSTKIVSSIVGRDIVKIEEELLEEISLTPSAQLKEKVNQIITNGTNGLSCDASTTTEDGKPIGIDCFSSGNHIVWHVYPK